MFPKFDISLFCTSFLLPTTKQVTAMSSGLHEIYNTCLDILNGGILVKKSTKQRPLVKQPVAFLDHFVSQQNSANWFRNQTRNSGCYAYSFCLIFNRKKFTGSELLNETHPKSASGIY